MIDVEIKEKDLVELDNSGWFKQISILNDLSIQSITVIDKPTLVYDYEACPDSWYSYVTELDDIKDDITRVYREIDGELKLIYKKENK